MERPSHGLGAMRVRPLTLPLALVVSAIVLTACNPAPSRSEALDALRGAAPGIDTATAYVRVWQDGPPWFSCAEVIAKFSAATDSAAVRDQVGNWKPLVLAGWLVLHDTTRGVVSDPGWCRSKLTNEPARLAGGWIPIVGDSFPTRSLRRGWRVPVGTRRLAVVAAPKAVERDAATVEYVTTVVVNANGAATGADRDSVFAIGALHRIAGQWRVVSTRFKAQGPVRRQTARRD